MPTLYIETSIVSYVAKEKLFPCTNCGMASMHRDIALAKLKAFGMGAAGAREIHG